MAGNGAPTEMIRHGEDQQWRLVETSGPGLLPFVGMKGITVNDKFYVLGRLKGFWWLC